VSVISLASLPTSNGRTQRRCALRTKDGAMPRVVLIIVLSLRGDFFSPSTSGIWP
jgi:hypothetical protein